MKTLLSTILLILSSGCTTLTDHPGDGLLGLALDDLRAAHIDAVAHGDHNAARCYSGLLNKLEAAEEARMETIGMRTGAVYAYQRARDVRRFLSDPALADACAGISVIGRVLD